MTHAEVLDLFGSLEDALDQDPRDLVSRCALADLLEEHGIYPDLARHHRRLVQLQSWLLTRAPRKHARVFHRLELPPGAHPGVSRYRRVRHVEDWWRWDEEESQPPLIFKVPSWLPTPVFNAGEHSGSDRHGVRFVWRKRRQDALAWLEAAALRALSCGWEPAGP